MTMVLVLFSRKNSLHMLSRLKNIDGLSLPKAKEPINKHGRITIGIVGVCISRITRWDKIGRNFLTRE